MYLYIHTASLYNLFISVERRFTWISPLIFIYTITWAWTDNRFQWVLFQNIFHPKNSKQEKKLETKVLSIKATSISHKLNKTERVNNVKKISCSNLMYNNLFINMLRLREWQNQTKRTKKNEQTAPIYYFLWNDAVHGVQTTEQVNRIILFLCLSYFPLSSLLHSNTHTQYTPDLA